MNGEKYDPLRIYDIYLAINNHDMTYVCINRGITVDIFCGSEKTVIDDSKYEVIIGWRKPPKIVGKDVIRRDIEVILNNPYKSNMCYFKIK
jgi:hypothetical protein